AELDQVIYDGSSFGTAAFAGSAEEQEYLGLPGLLEPEQVRALLRERQQRQLERPAEPAARPVTVAERLGGLRKELNTLVTMYHHRTGKPHGAIHSELRRTCGGPPVAMATAEQLQQRIATLRTW
ncbi:MAG TPA: ATP-dependent helicase, partial [Actinophytocola sp.]|nr:ATP-dependent helicase [Actinophytocola sp.]